MEKVFKKTKGLLDVPLHYCPGCTHGIIHRLIGEVLEELDIIDTAIGVSPVGCTYNNYEYFACDMVQAAHGRAPAVATGIKRVHAFMQTAGSQLSAGKYPAFGQKDRSRNTAVGCQTSQCHGYAHLRSGLLLFGDPG